MAGETPGIGNQNSGSGTRINRKPIAVEQRAKEEPCGCVGCGLVSWVWFGPPESLEREAKCGGCGKRQFFKRPSYHDEVLCLPLVVEDREVFPMQSWRTLMEHNRMVLERQQGNEAAGQHG